MTQRFRSDYGSAGERNGAEDNIPLGEIQGLAGQTTACVSMRGVWLALPITLTSIAVALAVWRIVTNRRHRHRRPVWKDDISPLIFYGHDLVDSALDQYRYDPRGPAPPHENADQTAHRKVPLESSGMQKIGKSAAVTVPWLRAMDYSGEPPAVPKRAKWSWRTIASRKDAIISHVTDTDKTATTLPGAHGGQATAEDTDPREADHALESAQGDRNAEPSSATDMSEYIQTDGEAQPQPSSRVRRQPSLSGEAGVWTFEELEPDMQSGDEHGETARNDTRVNQGQPTRCR